MGTFATSNPDTYYVEGYDINPYSGYDNRDLYHEWWNGVTLWDVIEHLFRPDQFLQNLKSEYVFIATPNATGLDSDLVRWKHYKPDEHQHYFTASSLAWMMQRAGYKIAGVYFDEGALRDPEHPESIITIVGRRE